MRLLGVTDIDALNRHMVNTRELDAFIMTDLADLKIGRPKL